MDNEGKGEEAETQEPLRKMGCLPTLLVFIGLSVVVGVVIFTVFSLSR